MNNEQIMHQMQEIFRDVLDNSEIVLTRSTVASDVEEWDSLNHIQLIVAIEKHFRIRFSSSEIQQFEDVGGLQDSISEKLGGT